MDNPTTLIVAIMYVTIVSIGLSNLLMAISEVVGARRPVPDGVHLSWVLLLLFAYFGYYWQTTLLLDVENWRFVGFVGFLVGPIILMFATNLLIDLPDEDTASKKDFYLANSNRFFTLLGLFMAWGVGLDVVVASVSTQTWIGGLTGLLCLGLAITNSYGVHKIGAVVGWALFLSNSALDVLAMQS